MSNAERSRYSIRPSRSRTRSTASSQQPQPHPETFADKTARSMPADMRINIMKYASWLPTNVNIMHLNPFDFLQLHHIYTSNSNKWTWHNDAWWFHDKHIEPPIFHRLDFKLENIHEVAPGEERNHFQQWQLGITTHK